MIHTIGTYSRKPQIIFLMITLLLLSNISNPILAQQNNWVWTGISGTVRQILVNRLTPNILYARIDPNRIEKSLDAGLTWNNVADTSWQHISNLALAPTNPNILYVTTSSGVYRSDNSGTSWQLIHPDQRAQAIAVSPNNSQITYIASSLSALSYTNVISKTIDGGLSWVQTDLGIPPTPPIDGIAIAPSTPAALIAKPWNMANGPLYKSANTGQNWFSIGSSDLQSLNTVAFDPQNSNIIYVGTFSPGAWKSVDGGQTWQPLTNGLQQNVVMFQIDPLNTQIIHVANLSGGVRESVNGGQTWASINGLEGFDVTTIAVASRQPYVIYAGVSGGGVWKIIRPIIQPQIYLPLLIR